MKPLKQEADATHQVTRNSAIITTKLTKKKPFPYIGRYVSTCNSIAAHIRNSSVDAIKEHKVDMMSYRLIQSKKGLQKALTVCCIAGGAILVNLTCWRLTKIRLYLLSSPVPAPEFFLNLQNYCWYKGSINELRNQIQSDLGHNLLNKIENLPNDYHGRTELLETLQRHQCPTNDLEKKLYSYTLDDDK